MMASSSVAASTASDSLATPGFRFYPTEEELLGFYLRHRLAGARPDVHRVIPVVDVYSFHPSQLRSMAGEASVRDTEQWFFFCPRADRELHGGRPARTTPSGYWKATGSPSCVFSAATNRVIGVKRTMVFYQGRAPAGTKTSWKMNEYKAVVADDGDAVAAGAGAASYSSCVQLRNELSVCRVYISTGTLRSFDRRPLDIPPLQLQKHVVVPSAASANLAGVEVGGAQAESFHDGSSPEDDAATEWNSLIDLIWS